MTSLRRWPDHPKTFIVAASLAACLSAAAHQLLFDDPHGFFYRQIEPSYPQVLQVLKLLLVMPAAIMGPAAAMLGYRRRLAGLTSAWYVAALVLPTVTLTGLAVLFCRDSLGSWFPGHVRYSLRPHQVVRGLMAFHVAQAVYAAFAAVLIAVVSELAGWWLAERRTRKGSVDYAPVGRPGLLAWIIEHPVWATCWVWIVVFGLAVLTAGTLGVFGPWRWEEPVWWWYTAADWTSRAALPLAVLTGALLVLFRIARGYSSRALAIMATIFVLCTCCGMLARARAFQEYENAFLAGAVVGYPSFDRVRWDDSRFHVSGVVVDLTPVERVVKSQKWLSGRSQKAINYLNEPILLGLAFASLWAVPIMAVLGVAILVGYLIRRQRIRLQNEQSATGATDTDPQEA